MIGGQRPVRVEMGNLKSVASVLGVCNKKLDRVEWFRVQTQSP